LAVALPLVPPKQSTLTCALMLALDRKSGVEVVAVAVAVQRLASLTVTMYVPAPRLVAVDPFCTGLVFHENVLLPVPPLTLAVALPLLPPKQSTLTCALMLALNAVSGCVMVALAVAVQPLASLTVTMYVPAPRLVAVEPFCTGLVFHENVLLPVPPLALAVALPLVPPKQSTLTCAL